MGVAYSALSNTFFAGLDRYYADPAQPLTMAGEELDGLDHDISDLSEV